MQEFRVLGSEISPEACANRSELGAFLDSEFDGKPGLLEEFPILVGECNSQRRFVLKEGDQIVSHAAWRPLTLCSGGERIGAAGIGLVTTKRSRRGRGLASRLVTHCMEDAEKSGAEVVMLFAPQRRLYTNLGFVPVGRERMIGLEVSEEVPRSGGVRRADADDVPSLLRLLEEHSLRVERTLDDFRTLLAVRGTHGYLLERDGEKLAYCVEGKGRDLRGVVHEWAGEPESLDHLLRTLAKGAGGALTVMGPQDLPAPCPGSSRLQPLAQLRILRAGRFGGQAPEQIFGDPETPARLPIYMWGLDSF